MENTEAATTVVENPYGLGALWEQGDFVAKGTLIIMVIMSLTSWYVIIMKFLDQRKLMASAKVAEQKFWTAVQNFCSATLAEAMSLRWSRNFMMMTYQEVNDMITMMISVPLATKSPCSHRAPRPYGFSTTVVAASVFSIFSSGNETLT